MDGQIERWMDRCTNERWMDGQIERWMDREMSTHSESLQSKV